MAETVTIQGQSYLKRNPLGVLGLGFITLGIYFVYWYYKANQEIQRYTGDQTISPSRSLLAVIPGFLLIVPPFIAIPIYPRSSICRDRIAANSSATPSRRCACLFTSEINLL